MSTPPARTNIVCIVADDLNAWIGSLGRNPDVMTPHIDALARRGVLFTHAYCPAPYCNASRVSTFTGRMPATTGVYQSEPYWEQAARAPTIVELLRGAGYHTYGAGKVFHGGFQYRRARRRGERAAPWNDSGNRLDVWDGFDVNGADPIPQDRLVQGLFDDAQLDASSAATIFDWGTLPDADEAAMPDGRVSGAVADFLRKPPREPFFCAAGLYKPHLPWYLPDRFFKLYEPDRLSLPVVKDDDLDDVPPIARSWALKAPNHHQVTAAGQWRSAVHAYLAAISYCDERVGEILAALDESPARDRTAVVLFGDNGFHLGEKLHWRKFALWEEATRVPLVVLLPGDPAPVRVHTPVSLVDVFPTLLELAGLDPDPGAEGRSLVGGAGGAGDGLGRPALMTWGRGNHSVRSDAWRYTRYSDGSEELYDHAVDGYEWTNLAGSPRYADVIRVLATRLPADG